MGRDDDALGTRASYACERRARPGERQEPLRVTCLGVAGPAGHRAPGSNRSRVPWPPPSEQGDSGADRHRRAEQGFAWGLAGWGRGLAPGAAGRPAVEAKEGRFSQSPRVLADGRGGCGGPARTRRGRQAGGVPGGRRGPPAGTGLCHAVLLGWLSPHGRSDAGLQGQGSTGAAASPAHVARTRAGSSARCREAGSAPGACDPTGHRPLSGDAQPPGAPAGQGPPAPPHASPQAPPMASRRPFPRRKPSVGDSRPKSSPFILSCCCDESFPPGSPWGRASTTRLCCWSASAILTQVTPAAVGPSPYREEHCFFFPFYTEGVASAV